MFVYNIVMKKSQVTFPSHIFPFSQDFSYTKDMTRSKARAAMAINVMMNDPLLNVQQSS